MNGHNFREERWQSDLLEEVAPLPYLNIVKRCEKAAMAGKSQRRRNPAWRHYHGARGREEMNEAKKDKKE